MTCVLVCGGREYHDKYSVFFTLDAFHEIGRIRHVIEGGASGADDLAREWADKRGVPHSTFRAEWGKYGRKAGPMRNQRMLDEGKPEFLIAFPGGRGTEDMVRRAEKAGVIVHRVHD